MSGRPAREDRHQLRRAIPRLEQLDQRELLTSAVGHSLGSVFVPATTLPRVGEPATVVNLQTSLNNFLIAEFGPAMETAAKQSQNLGGVSNNLVAKQVLSEPFIAKLLSRQDTYTLLSTVVSGQSAAFSNVFGETGPIVESAIKTAQFHGAPNAPRQVPGLRLPSAVVHNGNVPGSQNHTFFRAMHTAVSRHVFDLSPNQERLVFNGLSNFITQVNAMNQAGAFTPSVPLPGPKLPVGPLRRTVEVTLGSLRNLSSVASPVSGLPLPIIGNFPGRIDVGYVFDSSGNFGIAFTARGPLSPAPTHVASPDTITGDVRVEFSNAPSLSALTGTRVVEGLTQGTVASGDLQVSTLSNGVSALAMSFGYGSGLEFGTGVEYTQVVPLGNVNALIPEFPK
jgi:hypothetical protein